jgi:Ion channel
LLAIIILIKKIIKASLVNTNLLFGALLTYLLAGIFWGKLYFLENLAFPMSFKSEGVAEFQNHFYSEIYNLQFNLFYYSFTVLTTVGLGDIVPIHHLSKSLTILEAMFGQLFVAIIIAKLVSLWQRQVL